MPVSSLSLRRLALCLIAGLACLPAASQALDAPAARIVHDGRFEDWAAIAPVATDPDDQPAGSVDLRALAITNDEQFLRLRIAFADVVQLQENNDLVLHIDTDADATTGQPVSGIGADLSFAFGSRSGTVVVDGSSIAVRHAPLRLSWAPTFSAPEFEVEIALDAVVGGAPVFVPQIRLLLEPEPHARFRDVIVLNLERFTLARGDGVVVDLVTCDEIVDAGECATVAGCPGVCDL